MLESMDFQNSEQNIELYNLNGVLLMSKKRRPEQNGVPVNTSNLASGLYPLKVQSGENSTELKVMIMK